jgi:hypothetical protein
MARVLGLALSVALWIVPPPVLQTPSRTGPEGPPRPYGAAPRLGVQAPATSPGLERAQDRRLLEGPFPSTGLARGISDGNLLLNPNADVRAQALQLIRDTGASIVRIPVDWRAIVAPEPPPGFDAGDPSSPYYDFSALDGAIESTLAAGLEPLLVVSHAPAFAEAPGRWAYAYPGSWAPDPTALGQFAQALATRYDGRYPAPGGIPGTALPRVSLFQAWNEPNLARYLEPQWVANGRAWLAFSPLLYRELLNGFYAGVKSVQPGATVIAAGVAPNGDPAGEGRMAPVTFLQTLLCIDARGRRVSSGCPDPPHFDVLDFHPLSVGNPDLPAASSLEVSIADAAKITRLLAQAEDARTALPLSVKPLWVTELNWESAPQARGGVPPGLQAQWVSRALHRLWVAGVGLVAWQFLIDPSPGVRAETPTGGVVEYPRPVGLYSAGIGGSLEGARPKLFLQGFTLPFDPLRVSVKRVRVWALLMAPDARAVLQRARPDGAWQTIARLRADAGGVLNALVSLRGAVRLRLGSGALVSAIAAVPRHRSRL